MDNPPEQRKRIIVSAGSLDSAGRFVTPKKTKTSKKNITMKKPTSSDKMPNAPHVSPSVFNTIRNHYLKKQNGMKNNVDMVDTPKTEFQKSLEFIQGTHTGGLGTHNKNTVGNHLPTVTPPIDCHHVLKPSFGCLKTGGVLPTYRTWAKLAQTPPPPVPTVQQQQQQQQQVLVPSYPTTPVYINNIPPQTYAPPQLPPNIIPTPVYTNQPQNSQEPIEYTEMQHAEMQNPEIRKQPYRSRKTIRKFQVGKNKQEGKVGVLLKNITQRKRISQQQYALNSTPLHQIKKKLVRAGLIKIGSDAPENILRKMYENMVMIGGPVKNYSPEIVAYNLLQTDSI